MGCFYKFCGVYCNYYSPHLFKSVPSLVEKLSNRTTVVLTLAAWPFIRLIFCNAKILQCLLTEEFHSCLMRPSVHLCVHRKRTLEKVLEKLLSMVTSTAFCL